VKYGVMMKLNTGVPGDWIEVTGISLSDLVENCINAMYHPDFDGYLEVLEIKDREDNGD